VLETFGKWQVTSRSACGYLVKISFSGEVFGFCNICCTVSHLRGVEAADCSVAAATKGVVFSAMVVVVLAISSSVVFFSDMVVLRTFLVVTGIGLSFDNCVDFW
jgi:hypothetical protein